MENNSITKVELWAYISSTADQATIQKVEQWKLSNQYDDKLFSEIELIYKETAKQELPFSLEGAKKKFFKNIDSTTSTPNSFGWKELLRYAAILLVVFGASFFAYQNFTDNAKQVLVQTTYGEQKRIDLPDGSTVWLNASSNLSYSETSPRKIYLEGEAFFEVAKDKNHPFIVSTVDHLNVKALGTSFNVKSYKESNFTETILYTGKVEITSDKHFKNRILMSPNEKVYFSKINHEIVKSKAEFMESSIAWKEGKIQFKNKPFNEIADDLSIQYNIKISFENEQLSNSKFTGSFDASTPIGEILETLKLSKDFEYNKIKDNKWVIK